MPLIIFAFTLNPETQEAAITGNVDAEVALQILQKLCIAQAVQRASKESKKKTSKEKKKDVPD